MKALVSGRLGVFGRFLGGEFYPRTDAVLAELSSLFVSRDNIVPTWKAALPNHSERGVGLSSLGLLIWTAIRDFGSLLGQRSLLKQVDVVYLPYPAYVNLPILQVTWLGLRRKPLIIDAFLCLHDTVVRDRRLVPGGSVRARLVEWVERRTLRAADYVLIDTVQQRDLLAAQYGLSVEKFIVTPVGIDEDLWRALPPEPETEQFNVVFWGTFIPLHGISTIVSAAALLEKMSPSVRIVLVGDGQEGDRIAEQLAANPLTNVAWYRELMPAAKLYELVASAHCVLGVFGTSSKAASVVPYKVYQALAANRLLITRSGLAMQDLLAGEDSLGVALVEPGDPEALAEAVANCVKRYPDNSKRVPNRVIYDKKLSRRQLRAALQQGLRL